MQNKKRMDRLIFIYGSPSEKLAALVLSVPQVLGDRGTLCAVAGDQVHERAVWKRFESRAGVELDYLSPEELAKLEDRLGSPLKLPAAVGQGEGETPMLLLDAATLERASGTPEDLRGRLSYHASLHKIELPLVALNDRALNLPKEPPKRQRSVVRWVR